MRLSEYARSRDNNFTLLRLLAAFTVVLAHSWSALGINGRDFVYDYVGREIAEMALDMLFVTSGFLVTASLFNRGDLTHFLWARALRLFPAMWLMVPLTVFVLAPALTTLPVKDYLESPATWEYVRKTATVVGGVRWSLPGVFETLPLKGEFNGSLWTLPIEARMYIYLAVGWIAFAWWPQIRVRTLSYVAPIAAAVMFVVILRARAQGVLGNGNVEIFMFFMGSSLYFWREKLFMNRITFVALPLIVIAASLHDRTDRRLPPLSPVRRAVHAASRLYSRRSDQALQCLGRLFLRRLYLRFPRPADARASLSQDHDPGDGRKRGGDLVRPCLLLVEPGREAGDGTEGRLRRGHDAGAERGRGALCALARGSQAEQALSRRAV